MPRHASQPARTCSVSPSALARAPVGGHCTRRAWKRKDLEREACSSFSRCGMAADHPGARELGKQTRGEGHTLQALPNPAFATPRSHTHCIYLARCTRGGISRDGVLTHVTNVLARTSPLSLPQPAFAFLIRRRPKCRSKDTDTRHGVGKHQEIKQALGGERKVMVRRQVVLYSHV
jgi:hypothetical protein